VSVLSALSARHGRTDGQGRRHREEVRRPSVLVVDDDPLVSRLICTVLSPRYAVIAVADGLSAVLRARDESPDVIILDYLLPGLLGYEACRQIKADPRCADAKIMVLTAYPEAGGSSRAREAGADEFLRKPFSPTTLLNLLDRLASG
jgi:CheY-like chemotaxis protein